MGKCLVTKQFGRQTFPIWIGLKTTQKDKRMRKTMKTIGFALASAALGILSNKNARK